MKKLMLSLVAACAALVSFGSYVQAWRGLPAGYTQVEYIESTGSQYIDTDIVPGTSTAVDFTFNLVAYESGKAFFGQKWSNNYYLFNEQSDKFYFHGGGDLKNDLAGDYGKVIVGNDYRCQIEPTESNSGTLTLTWGGVTRSCTVTLSAGSGKMRIFGSTDSGHFSKIKVYGMKIWQGGELVADLVPAIDGEGKGGLYNLIGEGNNWLANGGTEALKVGAAVPDPNPDGFTPMLTATGARRIYRLGAYEIYEWTDTGDGNGFTVPEGGVIADVLLVGGGGAGGMTRGGGGGGGGVSYLTSQDLAAGAYTVTVGAGGIPQYDAKAYQSKDNNGETYSKGKTPDTATGGSSSVSNGGDFEHIVLGGGGGGCFNYGGNDQVGNSAGLAGGCGGGAGGHNEKAISGGTGIEGQGYAGANNANPSSGGGGGGGAGAVGGKPDSSKAGDGGDGKVVDITGFNVCYGGGGGGGGYAVTYGVGGDGGGGDGNYDKHGPLLSQNGVDGLGGGGGGGGAKSNNGWYGVGGVGGSGTVIVRVLLQGMIGLALSTDNSNARELGVTATVNASDNAPTDMFDVYAAIGADVDNLGEFVKIAEGAALNEACNTVFGGLDASTDYCVAVKAQNVNSGKWSEVLTAKATTSSLAYPVTAVGPGIVKSGEGYTVSLRVANLQYDVENCTATLNGESQTVSAAGDVEWTVPDTGTGCSASIILSYSALGQPYSQTFSASVRDGESLVMLDEMAGHDTLATALRIGLSDKVLLPPLVGRAQYVARNNSFVVLDGNELTPLKPGLVGVDAFDAAGDCTATLAVIILPEPIGTGKVFILDETKNSDGWCNAANWQAPDGSAADGYPHGADDIAMVLFVAKSPYSLRFNSDIVLASLYLGSLNNGASEITVESNNGGKHLLTFERTDGGKSVIQLCGNSQTSGGRLNVRLGGYETHFLYKNDTDFDGGWDGINAGLACGRPTYFSGSPHEIPAGVTLAWRNIDTTGSNMGNTFSAPTLIGEGTVWNRSGAVIGYDWKSDGFTGVIRDSGHGALETNRSAPTFFRSGAVTNASAEAYGYVGVANGGSPSADAKLGVGFLRTGWDAAYGAPGVHDSWLPAHGLTLVNSFYWCGSTENGGWGKGVAEVKHTEKFTVGRGFSYIYRHNNRNNKDGHPINWFETDALVHADKGTIRVDDYHRSNYADVSDTTNTVTILRGFKNFAVGGTGDPKTSENYPIIPWMVTPSYRTDNGKLAFTCFDAEGRVCDMATRTNRKLDEVTDENENVYANNNTTALTADRTVNSLWIWNQNQEKKFGADRTLTVKSGGVIFRADASSFGTKDGGDANGAVVLGDATKPGYIFAEATNASNPNSIYAKVTAPGGLVFGYTGCALLAGDQTGVDDELVVNAGTLDLGSQDKTVACTLDVPVRILANATVKLNNVEMKDSAVYFDDIAGYSGKIQLNAAETKCLKLYRRDTPEETEWTSLPRGTYSAETHPDLFTGTGTLVVRKDDLASGCYIFVK